MELISIWRVIVRRWWLIVLPMLVALLISIPTLRAVISPPVSYTLAIRFTASPKPGAGDFQQQSYLPWLTSEYTVTNLALWIHTDSFAQEVSAQLATQNKTIAPDALRGVLTSDNVHSVLTLYVTAWPNADDLKAIGDACSAVMTTKAETYFPQLGAQKLIVVALDQVNVTALVPPITQRLAPLGRIAIGLLFGIALAFLAEYLDRTLRTRGEVEGLGLAVLAEIPAYRA